MNLFLGILTVLVSGMFFVLLAVGQGARRARTFPGLIPSALFMGIGIVAMQLFFYNAWAMEYTKKNIIVVPLILLILTAAKYLSTPVSGDRRELRASEPHQKFSRFEKLLIVGMAFQLFWIVFQVLPVPLHSHDVVANYGLKAKMFALSSGIPEGFFTWPEASVAHPDYPPALPFLLTWVYKFTGFNDLTVNMVMPVIYVVFLFLIYSQLSRFFSRAYSILMIFILATVPQLADYATIMYADLILCALVASSMGFFILYISKRDRGCIFVSAMLMATSVWLKNEAIVFVGALFACMGVLFFRSRGSVGSRTTSDILKSIAIIAAMTLPWLLFRSSQASVNSDMDFASLTPDRLMQNVRDIPVLLNLFQQEVFGPKKWNIFWVLFFSSFVIGRKEVWHGENFYLTFFVVLSTLGYFGGYMSTTSNNLFFYVNTTISRFMLHFTGVCLLLMAKLMYDAVKDMDIFQGEVGEYYG